MENSMSRSKATMPAEPEATAFCERCGWHEGTTAMTPCGEVTIALRCLGRGAATMLLCRHRCWPRAIRERRRESTARGRGGG